MEDIPKHCRNCRHYVPPPIRFKAAIPTNEHFVFGNSLSIDLLFLDRDAVLHVIDTATRFSSSCFLRSHKSHYRQSVEGAWKSLLENWCTIYIEYLDHLRPDQGSVCTFEKRKESSVSGLEILLSCDRAHSSLEIYDFLHEPLLRMYDMISVDFEQIDKNLWSKKAFKAMIDTIVENVLVPSALVFSVTQYLSNI